MFRRYVLLFIATTFSSIAYAQQGTTLFARAHDLLVSGDIETSVALFRRGLELEPNNGRAHYYLAQALLKNTPPDSVAALEHFKRASQLAPSTEEGADAYAQSLKLEAKLREVAQRPRLQATGEAPPTMFVGDRWMYRSGDGSTMTCRVTASYPDLDNKWFGECNERTSKGRVERYVLIRQGGWNNSSVFTPHDGLTVFPLTIGRSIDHSYETLSGKSRSRSYRVAGWARIKVPAGEFNALVLQNEKGANIYYSPAVKAFLSFQYQVGGMFNRQSDPNQYFELMDYSITEDGGAATQ